MNKTRIVLMATGGVIALAVLAAAYFTWDAFSSRKAAFEGNDESEGLESIVGRVSSLMGKKPYPSKANKNMLDANRRAVEEWRREAWKQAAVGDWCPDASSTPAQFKESVVREARRLAAYPGSADGKIMKSDFAFGPFKDYLADKMPSKEQMPRLQRQWYDIAALCDLLATNGVTQIVDLQTVVRADAEPKPDKKSANKKRPRKTAKPEAAARQPSVETYRVVFESAPAAFVAILRQLSFQERFTSVDGFTFAHVRDAISESLGSAGDKKDAAAKPQRRRAGGRRRAAAAEPEEKPEEEKKSGLVFNPETDATVRVELTVSVYDFRTLEDDKEEESK